MWILLSLPALAFSPGVHRALAERAMVLEGVAGEPDARRFASAAANEDWDLPRKWTRWHHYYSPDFPVHSLWRRPSEARVAWLTARIDAGLGAWSAAGLLAHHLQDMASPPHVVPIAHGLGDDFEGWDFRAAIAEATGELVLEASPAALQRSTAEATLAAIAAPMRCDTGDVAWTEVWVARPGRWGRRGPARFGQIPGCEAAMTEFAGARIEDALAATRAVIRYAGR